MCVHYLALIPAKDLIFGVAVDLILINFPGKVKIRKSHRKMGMRHIGRFILNSRCQMCKQNRIIEFAGLLELQYEILLGTRERRCKI